jgi:ABC-2 type transport system permease protein
LSYVAVGIAVSCFTSSQVIGAVISLVILLLLHVIDAPAQDLGNGVISELLRYLSPPNHAAPFLKGVIESSSVIYFVSLMFAGLFVAGRALDAHRWR